MRWSVLRGIIVLWSGLLAAPYCLATKTKAQDRTSSLDRLYSPFAQTPATRTSATRAQHGERVWQQRPQLLGVSSLPRQQVIKHVGTSNASTSTTTTTTSSSFLISNDHLPRHTRPLEKIIDLYPHFGVSSGAPVPLTELLHRPRRYDRVITIRNIQWALDRLGTREIPPLFSKPMYTLGPDVPFRDFLRYLVFEVPPYKYSVSCDWLKTHQEAVLESIEGLIRYALRHKATAQKFESDPTQFQDWYARLSHYGMVRSPIFQNQITFLQSYGKRIFRNAPLIWIPGYPEMDEAMRGDVAFLYHQLLIIRVLQVALQHPEYVEDELARYTIEAPAQEEVAQRWHRKAEQKAVKRLMRGLSREGRRHPGQRGKDKGPRAKRIRLIPTKQRKHLDPALDEQMGHKVSPEIAKEDPQSGSLDGEDD